MIHTSPGAVSFPCLGFLLPFLRRRDVVLASAIPCSRYSQFSSVLSSSSSRAPLLQSSLDAPGVFPSRSWCWCSSSPSAPGFSLPAYPVPVLRALGLTSHVVWFTKFSPYQKKIYKKKNSVRLSMSGGLPSGLPGSSGLQVIARICGD